MAKITKVPNGPLIKKKGPFKGSTLKTGGKIKKAQDGFNKIKPGTKQTTPKYNVPESRFVITNDTAKVKPTRWINNPMPSSKDKKEFPMPSEALMDSVSKASLRNIDTSKLMKKKSQTGGKIKKAQVGIYEPMNKHTKFKTRSADGNYKLKLKGDKLVERRTLKGFFSGAPRAQGKMDLDADNVKLLKSLRSITNANDPSSSKDKNGVKSNDGSWDSIRPKYPTQFKFAKINKNGGPVKKAQNGGSTTTKPNYSNMKTTKRSFFKDKDYIPTSIDSSYYKQGFDRAVGGKSSLSAHDMKTTQALRGYEEATNRNLNPKKKPRAKARAKAGAMIKRADGSMSKRGLWDNIRANKGSGKKPTKQMLVQEKKIKAKSKK